MINIKLNYLFALVLGLVCSAGFHPIHFWLAPIIALGLLYQITINLDFKQRWFISQIFGLGVLAPTQYWTGTYVGNLPWLALSLMQSFLFVPIGLFLRKNPKWNPFIFAFGLVTSELLLRTVPFTGFGWSRISFTQADSPLSFLYPILGCAGVAFSLAYIAANRRFSVLLLISILIFAGNFHKNSVTVTNKINVALVQGGVSKLGLDFNAIPQEVFNSHLKISYQRIKPNEVDLVIWPENSVDIDLFRNENVKQKLVDLSSALNTPILIGGISRKSADLQNISVLFDPLPKQIYAKRYLTPFGEYVPFRKLLSKFNKNVADVSDFSAGKDTNIFKLESYNLQTLICYELLNDAFRDQLTADMIVVQTNNATFGDTAQLEQEREIARVRAMETNREVAYVSTTGVTSIINKQGLVIKEIPKFKPDILISSIFLGSNKTLTQKLGLFPELLSVIMLFLFSVRIRRRN
ncbi:unannotated protein [freshwater metagenome]|uniref:Unannotated protein n=1 Tax=freshwater metagenome TaxID=449393 RepID=A0A6J6YKA7_9ZZZZ